MRVIVTCALALFLAAVVPAHAQDPKTEDEKVLYALGPIVSQNLSWFDLTEAELKIVEQGMRDGALKKTQTVDLQTYGPWIQELQKTRVTALAASEKKAGQAFLEKAAGEKDTTRTASGVLVTTLTPGTRKLVLVEDAESHPGTVAEGRRALRYAGGPMTQERGIGASDTAVGERVRAVLDGLGVPYEIMTIDPDFADTAQFCAKYGIPLDQSANTIVVASKKEPKQYCACLVLATTRLDVNHAVRKLMNVSRVSFAGAEETKELTGMLIGGVTVFALPEGLPIYVDERVIAPDWIIVGGGGRSTKVKLAPDALRRLPNVAVVAGLATEIPPASGAA